MVLLFWIKWFEKHGFGLWYLLPVSYCLLSINGLFCDFGDQGLKTNLKSASDISNIMLKCGGKGEIDMVVVSYSALFLLIHVIIAIELC